MTIIRLVALALLAGLTPLLNTGPAFALSIYESEPNDTVDTADWVALGYPILGTASSSGSNDVDYYKVRLPTAGRLNIQFNFAVNLGTGNAYSLAVVDQSGTTLYNFSIGASDFNGGSLDANAMYLPAGDTYIRVNGWYGDASWGQYYHLFLTESPGNVETETNNTRATADPINLDTTVAGSVLRGAISDDDYFALDLAHATSIGLTLTFPGGLGTGHAYRVTVFNRTGKELKDVQLTGARWNGSWLANKRIALAAGPNYIRVSGSHRDATWGKTYNLTVALALSKTPAPKVSGKAKVGKTLKATTKAWTPGPVILAYQWLRNGHAIPGATGSSYKVVKADKKKRLSVRVIGSHAGYLPAFKTSAARKVR